jgi:hypothetical protein
MATRKPKSKPVKTARKSSRAAQLTAKKQRPASTEANGCN